MSPALVGHTSGNVRRKNIIPWEFSVWKGSQIKSVRGQNKVAMKIRSQGQLRHTREEAYD
jgi:hypothetical protein